MSWYRAGTIAVTNGSAVITGTGTAFVANVQQGHAINLPDGRAYEVAEVNSDGQITLGSPYLGSTATGQAYSVQPNQGFAQQAATALANFQAQYGGYLFTSLSGKFPDGTVAVPSLTFSADQDTGFFRATTNVLGIAAGGVPIYVSTNGISLNTADGKGLGFLIDTERFTPSGGNSIARYGLSYNPYSAQGSVGLSAYGALQFFTHDTLRWTLDFNGHFAPAVDNTFSAGLPALRIAVVYAATGSINTSDERQKLWRGNLNEAELAAAKEIGQAIGVYQLRDAIAEKGDDARLHIGAKAQQVFAIMRSHGLDPARYGFCCYDAWEAQAATPEVPGPAAVIDADGHVVAFSRPGEPAKEARPAGDSYGLRYDELLCFVIAGQEQRLSAVELKLAA